MRSFQCIKVSIAARMPAACPNIAASVGKAHLHFAMTCANAPAKCQRLMPCSLIEAAFNYICEFKFSGQPMPAAPANIEQFGPVIPVDEDDGFEAETEALRDAMAESSKEQMAHNCPDSCTTGALLHRRFSHSALLAALLQQASKAAAKAQAAEGSSHLDMLAAPHCRTASFKFLQFEERCQKWWPGEKGLRPYFASLAADVATACQSTHLHVVTCARTACHTLQVTFVLLRKNTDLTCVITG